MTWIKNNRRQLDKEVRKIVKYVNTSLLSTLCLPKKPQNRSPFDLPSLEDLAFSLVQSPFSTFDFLLCEVFVFELSLVYIQGDLVIVKQPHSKAGKLLSHGILFNRINLF